MKYIFVLMALTGLLLVSAFTPQQNRELQRAIWLKGAWQNKSNGRISIEEWHQSNDSTLVGLSYFISGKDTTLTETINIQSRNGNLFYIPVVVNQNNNEPVYFRLTAATDTKLVFENPEHDFPQKISYTRIGRDSLVAEISGSIKGKMKARQFPMKKVKTLF